MKRSLYELASIKNQGIAKAVASVINPRCKVEKNIYQRTRNGETIIVCRESIGIPKIYAVINSICEKEKAKKKKSLTLASIFTYQ